MVVSIIPQVSGSAKMYGPGAIKVHKSLLTAICGFFSAPPASSILVDASFALLTAGMSPEANHILRNQKDSSLGLAADISADISPRASVIFLDFS